MDNRRKDLRLIMVCVECGSNQVIRDAWAVWDRERQQWKLGGLHESEFCSCCDQPTETEELPL